MRALMIVLAGAAFLTAYAYADDAQVNKLSSNTATKIVLASSDMKQVQKPPKVAKTQVHKAPEAAQTGSYVRVWSVEMACCEPQ
jgi:hypothetical protein